MYDVKSMKMKMWILIFFFCCALNNICCADYVQEVKVRLFRDEYDNGDLKCEGIPSTLVLNKPYRVYVNSSTDIYIYRARCYVAGAGGNSFLVQNFVKEPLDQRYGYVSNNVSPSTAAADKNYNIGCLFYTKCAPASGYSCTYYMGRYQYTDKGIQCNFKVDVVKAENIRVQSLGNLVVNQALFEVAGTHTYFFHDGEPTYFDCQKNVTGFSELTYKTKDGTSLSTGYHTDDTVSMYMKLTAALHNNTAMMCFIYPDVESAHQTIQTNLILKPRDDMKDIGFKINELLLKPYMQMGALKHEYYYYNGEILKIEAVKDDIIIGDLNCYFQNTTAEMPFALTTDKVKNLLKPLKSSINIFLYQGQSNLYLICKAQRLIDARTLHSSVKFIHQPEDYSPYITGLSFARILTQYNDHESNRNMQYEYMGNETLKLMCVDAFGRTKWLFAPSELIVNPNVPSVLNIQLYSHVNRTTIKCKSSRGKISSVELIRMTKVTETMTTVAPKVTTTVTPVLGNNVQPGGNNFGDSSRTSKANEGRSTTRKQSPIITIRPTSSPKQTKPIIESTLITSTLTSTSISTTTTAMITTQTSLEISSTKISTNLSATTNNNNDGNGDGGRYKKYVILAVMSVIALLLTITFVWAIMRLIIKRKRIPQRSNSSDIDYQNLPQHNEGTMPMPAQWNSQNNLYANTSGNTENLYSQPVPKNQRKPKIDPLYAQARDSKPIDTTYAAVVNTEPTYDYIQNTEPTYASVQNTEATYASIQNTEPTYASVQKTEPTYAEVGKKSAYQNLSSQSSSKNSQGPTSEPQYAQFPRKNDQNYANVAEFKKDFNEVCGNGTYANLNLKK